MSSVFRNVSIKGHKKNLVLRALILDLWERNQWGYKRITRKLWVGYRPEGISYDGLLSLTKRTLSRGTLEDKQRPGRNRTVRSVANLDQIKQRHYHQQHNPGQRSTAARLGISVSSVTRALRVDLKLKPFHKFKSSKMTGGHVKNRMESAEILLNTYGGSKRKSKTFLWHSIINSDYSAKIGLNPLNNTKNDVVYGTSRESIPRVLLESPREQFVKGFMVWGAISSRGLIPKNGPIFIDEFLNEYEWPHDKKQTMNAERYIDLLQEKIIPSIEQLYTDRDYIYQDDCESIHRAGSVIEFIEENMPNRIPPEYQAPKLDDVWPIENVWSIIRTELKKKDYENSNAMKQEVVKIWRDFDTDLCAEMMSSIPKRLQAVLDKDGRRILKSDY